MKIEETKLTNGAKIIGVDIPKAKSLTINIGFKTGSRNEDPQYAGISHFLEHMVFKGSKKRPTAREIAQEADGLGAIYNAMTEKEWTFYYIKTIPENFKKALDILADMAINPLLLDEELQKERGTIIEEIKMYQDMPSEDIDWRMEETMYGAKNPLGRDEIGTEQSVNNITQKAMAEYFDSQYVGGNCIVVIAGNLPRDYKGKISKYLTGLKNDSTEYPKLPQKSDTKTRLINKETEQAHIGICLPDYSYNDELQFASRIISASLGGFMSSRLFTEIREKRGLAYHIASYNKKYSDSGSFCIIGGIKTKKAEEAIKIIKDEALGYLDKLTSEEIEKTKGYLQGVYGLKFEDTEARAVFMTLQYMLARDPLTPEEFIEKILAVDKKQIEEAAKELFTPDNLYLTIIGPFKSEEKFAKILSR
ncbi:MAG: pitrilysin family protein [Patescibacteria group bacterium]|nr:pitrilysin family protein [Patescibacteria group bacterium]